MAVTGYSLEGLFELCRIPSRSARRASFRESVVQLVRTLSSRGPGPLEAVDPAAIIPSIRVALADGLLDDLDWLAPESAAVALYEIAAILPPGTEKREVGRRVALATYEGTASTFAAVATRMALGAGRGLSGGSLRARVALALELPAGVGERIDAMALALASRRELSREWIVKPSRGSLASRRLSSRLLERAACEAARLAGQGEPDVARCFRTEGVARAFRDLLADREPLVWRHAAIARGLLTLATPDLWAELEHSVLPALTPTEWRRGATSLAAALVGDPERAERRLRELLRSDIAKRDPGIAGCMLWGLAGATAFEPEVAERLAVEIVLLHADAVAETFEEAAREERTWIESPACRLLRRELALCSALFGDRLDAASAAMLSELREDLSSDPRPAPAKRVRGIVWRALHAFASSGARQAHEVALEALAMAQERLAMLEVDRSAGEPRGRPAVHAVLRDLDVALLESAVLSNLLALDAHTTTPPSSVPAVEALRERLCNLIVGWVSEPAYDTSASVEVRKLRTLIHLLDTEAEPVNEPDWRATTLRERWQKAAHVLVARLKQRPPAALHRAMAAALARALDGLVRAEICDAVDALLWIGWQFADPDLITTLGEASRDPDLAMLFASYAAFVAVAAEASRQHGHPGIPTAVETKTRLEALARLARALSGESSTREQALRDVLVRLGRSLGAIAVARSLSELERRSGAPSPMAELEHSVRAFGQLVTASRRHLADELDEVAPRSLGVGLSELDRATDRALAGDAACLAAVVTRFGRDAFESLPIPFAPLIETVVSCVLELPVRAPESGGRLEIVADSRGMNTWLPSWIPPSRTIGAYFIVRPIGAGGLGSVFLAKRIEERHEASAELFALKMPVYDPNAARQVSEAEFLRMFRSEASALLTLPQHPNVARFVTFDLGAKPKPILVMEYVDGVMLDRLIDSRQMSSGRAMQLLDGMLAGLEAMHAAGLGHLDVKPGNIVLARGKRPVLVDFGLAGRHIRPGCGSGSYSAPEIWGLELSAEASPMAADVYSASCIAFEILSGQPLFDHGDAMTLAAAHLAHDGWPKPLRAWKESPHLRPIAELLSQALRRDARQRIAAPAFRAELARMGALLEGHPWPVQG